jgi:nucleotide-binding universal stress UspA family protein
MPYGFQTIVHPTDFSDASAHAFAHALRIVLALRGTLYLVHVADSDSFDDGFPHVRQALGLWNLMNEEESPAAVGKLGIKVSKVGVESETPLSGLSKFLDIHPTDLIVIATHGRDLHLAARFYPRFRRSSKRATNRASRSLPASRKPITVQTQAKPVQRPPPRQRSWSRAKNSR